MTRATAEAPAALLLVAVAADLRDGLDALVVRADAAARGGATMLQLRLPDEPPRARLAAARRLVASIGIPVVLHDRADLAVAAGAAGVHLTATELPPRAVRPWVPPGFLIGVSVGTFDEARRVDGADYVGIGPVFGVPSATRRALGVHRFAELAGVARLPAIAIGGITAATAPQALNAGAAGVAVLGAIFSAEDPARAAREIRSAIGR
jgi:thiamine-phosphate pyrophosphorylase